MNIEVLQSHANNARINILKMIHSAKSGHPGGSLSSADILSVLYFNEMNINEENVNDVQRDKFVLSKGHASPLLYATLKEKGFLSQDDLMTFRKINSNVQGHPSKKHTKGVDMSTGSLGQGISAAVGMALSNKIHNLDYRTYVLVGDGESQEGQMWEALMAAGHYKLNNLCIILDYNGLQIDGKITDVMNPEPFADKYRAFGLNVIEIDGHNYQQIIDGFNSARECLDKPSVIIAHTIKGKGVSFMENQAQWHGQALNDEQLKQAINELEAYHG